MADELKSVLLQWKTGEEVIDKLLEEEYDMETLIHIPEKDLEKIIPRGGPRTRFRQKLETYKKSLESLPVMSCHYIDLPVLDIIPDKAVNLQEVLECELPSSPSTSESGLKRPSVTSTPSASSQEKRVKEYDLQDLLRSAKGQLVFAEYKQKGYLTESLRDKLGDIIIANELGDDVHKSLPYSRIEFLAEQIVAVFPTELKVVWLGTKSGKSSARGKLQNRYYNMRRQMIKCGLIIKSPSQASCPSEESTADDDDPSVCDGMEWLKGNSKPWTRVQEKWELTSQVRLRRLQDGALPIHEYMNQFPALKDPSGYLLFEVDFEVMHPNKSMKLYSEWPVLSAFIRSRLELKEVEAIDESLTEDGKKVRTLLSLNNLFTVVTVAKKKGSQWRPSRQECREGFLHLVQVPGDIQPELELRRAKYEKFGMTLAPQAMLVGTGEDDIMMTSYLVINQNIYEVESPMKALDMTFKAIHALDAQYPKECQREWLFMQRAVYGIVSQIHDKKILDQKTVSLIAEYERFKANKM